MAPVNAHELEETKARGEEAKPAEPEVVGVQLRDYYDSVGVKKVETVESKQVIAADEKKLEKFTAKNEKVVIKKPLDDQPKKAKKDQPAVQSGPNELEELVQSNNSFWPTNLPNRSKGKGF